MCNRKHSISQKRSTISSSYVSGIHAVLKHEKELSRDMDLWKGKWVFSTESVYNHICLSREAPEHLVLGWITLNDLVWENGSINLVGVSK